MFGLQYLILIPLAAGFLITLFGKKHKYAGETLSAGSALALLLISLSLVKKVLANGAVIYNMGNWLSPFGISLIGDSLSTFILVAANIVGLAVAIYSIGYVRQYTAGWKYYTLFSIMQAGVNGLILTGDIFNLFVFLEIASVAAYALFAFTIKDEALEGVFKYAVMSAAASSFILLGIAFLYSYTSTLNFADMASVIAARAPAHIILFVSALFLLGFGLKSALAPFHAGLADAYTASPVTIAAMSSGVLIKALGVYSLVRIFFNVFGMSPKVSHIFIALGAISMVGGSLLAFYQTNIRRLLAYSSISQVGYLFAAIGVGTPLALLGAFLHLLNHSASKSLLFLNAGAIEGYSARSDIDNISGIMRRDKICGWTSLIGAMSICGIPPLGGFWSKLIIIFACAQAGHIALAVIAVIVSIMTLLYYFRAFTPVLFAPAEPGMADNGYRMGRGMKFAMVFLAFISVTAGLALLPGPVKSLMDGAAAILINGSSGYVNTILGAIR